MVQIQGIEFIEGNGVVVDRALLGQEGTQEQDPIPPVQGHVPLYLDGVPEVAELVAVHLIGIRHRAIQQPTR